ncbi:AAA family ATPase [Candidatus Nomurabacteria bacterium]|nr:AAA family ATPase [Candidatus Nomurabacteria bacterium]
MTEDQSAQLSEKVVSARDIMNLDINDYPTLLQDILPIKGIVALAGASDLGKSLLLQQLSLAIAFGLDEFLGFKLNISKNRSLYVSTEDDDYVMAIRIRNLSKVMKGDKFENLRFIFNTDMLLSTLDAELSARPCSLVVLDAFADIFQGDLNNAVSVRQFIQPFKQLAQLHECLFIFNHHCGKNVQYKIPHKDNLLGSQGFESSMRTVIELRQDPTDKHKRHICIVKGNNISSEMKEHSYELDLSFENGFTFTGNRVPFTSLIQGSKSGSKSFDDNLIKRIIQYSEEGISGNQIYQKLNSENKSIKRTAVTEIIRNHKDSKLDNTTK